MRSPKALEKLAVEKYLKASNQSFEIEEFESPDFILKGKGNKIGCEVTEFYTDYASKGSSLKKRESFLNELHQKIRVKLVELFPYGYDFTINYNSIVSKRTSIEVEVNTVSLSVSENIESELIDEPSTNISRISIRKIGNFPTRISSFIASDYTPPKVEWFIPIIKAKTEKIKKWNETYDRKWLVISTGLSSSGDVSLRHIRNIEKLKSAYWDKIIIIDINFADYVEINSNSNK
ncbi:hypothetical protein [Psychroflexus sediminis]|uniref:Uncharacterized protein n=1 Tax=Psychroflexus sediminis TaxID=470826 RepID=A0A1G7TYC6_9FLAO|nr:hypothetical protein [Psychroflexus sediminis]SDG39480.1 hypothetical protein SAMN04488027_10194 [Psychroflexus sediminis]